MARTAAARRLIRLQRIQEFPAGDLPLVEAGETLRALEVLFDLPPGADDVDEAGEADGGDGVTTVEGQFTGVAVAADDEEGVPGGLAVGGGVVGADLDQRPVVVPVALQSVPGAHPHPGLRRDLCRELGGGEAACGSGGGVVGLDGQGVVEAEARAVRRSSRPAVDLVAGEPAGAHAQFAGPVQHDGGELGLGGETDLVGHVPQQAALLVLRPGGGQVQLPVDQDVAARRGVGEVHGDLAQLDPAQRAGILVSGAHAVGGGLLVPRLIDHQHRIAVGEFTRHPGGQPVTGQVVVPRAAGKEVLQPVRPVVAECLGERPAVAPLQLHQHRLGHLPCQQSRITAREAVGHLGHQRPERRPPHLLGYRGPPRPPDR